MMGRIRKSQHILKTVTKTRRKSLRVHTESIVEPESNELDNWKEEDNSPSKSEDGYEKKVYTVERSPDIDLTSNNDDSTKIGSKKVLESDSARLASPGRAKVPKATVSAPKTPSKQQQMFNDLFSKSSEDQKSGAKSLPGLRGRAAFGEKLRESKKRQLSIEASKSMSIKKMFRKQAKKASTMAATTPQPPENPDHDLP